MRNSEGILINFNLNISLPPGRLVIDSFTTIRAVARYECRHLLRGTLFRVFLALSAISALFFIGFFGGYGSYPSSLPYSVLLFLNLTYPVFIFFLTAEILSPDTRTTTTDALLIRSMTNAEYVLGKFCALFIVIFIVTSLILCAVLIFSAIVSAGAGIPLSVYLFYPLLITFPVAIYMLGLSGLCLSVLKNRALAAIAVIVYSLATVFRLAGGYPFLLDFSGDNMPLTYSDFVGFGGIEQVILQRCIFIALGMGFMCITVLLFRRLRQSRTANITVFLIALVCLTAAPILGRIYVERAYEGRGLRTRMNALNLIIAGKPQVTIERCGLDLVHNGKTIEVTADVFFGNATENSIAEYYFSLNPGLEITSLKRRGTEIEYTRDIHIVSFRPVAPLQPGETDSLSILYTGSIDENACYTDIDEAERETVNRAGHTIVGKRYSFIEPSYVLLTGETMWYPSAGVPGDYRFHGANKRDFVNFDLTVKTEEGLTVLSQGAMHTTEIGSHLFESEYPLPCLSLVIGDYETKSITVDGIEYRLCLHQSHDSFLPLFSDMTRKELEDGIRNSKQYFEAQVRLQYPFKRFSIVEVPIQFLAHQRFSKQQPENVQPEQVLIQERGRFATGKPSKSFLEFQKKNPRLAATTPGKLQQMMLENSAHRILLDSWMQGRNLQLQKSIRKNPGIIMRTVSLRFYRVFEYDFNVFPNYYTFRNAVSSEEHPLFGLALEFFLRSRLFHIGFFGSASRKSVNADVYARKALMKRTFEDILNDPSRRDLHYAVLKYKSETLFNSLEGTVGDEAFDDFLDDFLETHRFETASADDFISSFRDRFGIDISGELASWYTEKQFAEFILYDTDVTEVIHEGRSLKQFRFSVYNAGHAAGSLKAHYGFQENGILRTINLDPGEAKAIGIVSDMQYPYLTNIGFKSFNALNDRIFSHDFGRLKKSRSSEIFDGERITDPPPEEDNPGIIIDNTDTGFTVLTQRQEKPFLSFLGVRNRTDDDELLSFSVKRAPPEWRQGLDTSFYGKFDASAHYIQAGEGEQKVRWSAVIPESGRYDVYVYTPSYIKFRIPIFGDPEYAVGDFHYLVRCDGDVDEVTLDAGRAKEGWSYLGTYEIPRGETSIELTDLSGGRMVYADAVKWVRKDDM